MRVLGSDASDTQAGKSNIIIAKYLRTILSPYFPNVQFTLQLYVRAFKFASFQWLVLWDFSHLKQPQSKVLFVFFIFHKYK